jgi:hypothetical protein
LVQLLTDPKRIDQFTVISALSKFLYDSVRHTALIVALGRARHLDTASGPPQGERQDVIRGNKDKRRL